LGLGGSSYPELAQHYGTLVDPAWRESRTIDREWTDPCRKLGIPTRVAGEWASLAQLHDAALLRCREVAGARACRPLDGASPISLFEQVAADALAELPVKPFVLAT